jgi:thiamine biosynthesis lipoprotein
LGTTATVCVTEQTALTEALEILQTELDSIEITCSRFIHDSELMNLNRHAGEWVTVSDLLFEAIDVAVVAAKTTSGIVTPTIGRTLRLYGYDRTFEQVKIRDTETLAVSYSTVPSWRQIELDRTRQSIRIPKGTELDLGATAKALAADRASTSIAESVQVGVLVNLGGDIRVSGPAPESGWPILIADDHKTDVTSPGPRISIIGGGLATSSTTVRKWKAAGTNLHHIVDPRTGRPAQSTWQTVSVAADTCVDANSFSTAAIVLGNEAIELLASRNLPARLVRTDGQTEYVGGWPHDDTVAPAVATTEGDSSHV